MRCPLFARTILHPKFVSTALNEFLDGDMVTHLVSSGVNDVYRTERGRYVKVFDGQFVNALRLERVYTVFESINPSLHPFCIPIRKGSRGLFVMTIPLVDHIRYCAIFDDVGSNSLPIDDNAGAAKACRRVEQGLAMANDSLRPLLDILDWKGAIQALRTELTPWRGTAASVSVNRIHSCLQLAATVEDILSSNKLEPIHGDLHHQNIFIRGHQFSIIDLDFICLGPSGYDSATLAWMGIRSLDGVTSANLLEAVGQYDALFRDSIGDGTDERTRAVTRLILLRHVFFLTVQVKLWSRRGSLYARDGRTLKEIKFLELLTEVVAHDCKSS